MLSPADVLTDADLGTLQDELELEFGDQTTDLLIEKRRIAVLDWLSPRLEAAGYVPARHRTRVQPAAAWGYTASAYTNLTTAAGDDAAADVALSTVLATPSTDALYVGHTVPFRGLFVRLDGVVNANTSTLTVAAWTGRGWQAVSRLNDDTAVASGKTLSGGGRLSWDTPDEWVPRAVNDVTAYWVKLTVSAALSATPAAQILPIVRSRLAQPATLLVASLMHRSGSAGRRGAWLEQAQDEEARAEKALAVILPLIADEFDQDADDAVGANEASDVQAARDGVAWSLERG